MKKLAYYIIILFTLPYTATAQTKLLTMEEAILKQKTTLAPAKLKQLLWVKGTNSFSCVDTKDSVDLLMTGNAESNKQPLQVAITSIQLNEALRTSGFNSLKTFPQIQWKNPNEFKGKATKI